MKPKSVSQKDYIKEDGRMTKRCFDGTMAFHERVLAACKKYRKSQVPDVEKAIRELKDHYPEYAKVTT